MEVLTVDEMSQADRLTIAAGTSGFALMQRAGCAVADAAQALAPKGRILVVAGRGNNGGDGFVAAAELKRRGRDVAVMLLCNRDTLTGDAALAAQEWHGEVLPCDPGALGQPALIVDALFGAGLNRPPKGDPHDIIVAMNASGAPILSVDLPSGINGTTGEVMGVAVQATRTVTFFRRKPGHLLLPGRLHCGEVEVADIGIGAQVLDAIKPSAFENDPDLWRTLFPVPHIDGHKYARGHAVVVSGPQASTGAARLSARAALRAGAGLVTVASPSDALAVNAAALTAVMVRAIDNRAEFGAMLSDARFNACVIGPGLGVGERAREFVLEALGGKRGIVLDADALMSFADAPETVFSAIETARACQVVLTPHAGEFARLFKRLDDPALSKLERTRAAARESGAVVLLKGPDTVVAAPDGRASIAANAPPWLATAGSGDVLAGMIAGFLAQHVPAFEAASMAVWLHGEAARAFGPGLIAEDLPEMLPEVLRALYEAFSIQY
ncbi:NAD(P)H-hydrate dehydratase [Afipia sp. TerB]